jgi:hypothetical protein
MMSISRFFNHSPVLSFFFSSFCSKMPNHDVEGWKNRQGIMSANAADRHKIPTERGTLKKALYLWAAGALAATAAALLILIFGGEPLQPARRAVHIDWIVGDSRGVYADCNKVGNGLNRYCRKSYENSFRRIAAKPSRFKRPTHEAPFSLSETE